MLLPLIIGAAIRHYAGTAATKIFPAIKGLALLSTLLTIGEVMTCDGMALKSPAAADEMSSEVGDPGCESVDPIQRL